MAKPNSIPVPKRRSRNARATIPTVISFILAPPDFDNVVHKDDYFNETADPYPVGYGEEGELLGRGDLA
jgi:hypothetical protein